MILTVRSHATDTHIIHARSCGGCSGGSGSGGGSIRGRGRGGGGNGGDDGVITTVRIMTVRTVTARIMTALYALQNVSIVLQGHQLRKLQL